MFTAEMAFPAGTVTPAEALGQQPHDPSPQISYTTPFSTAMSTGQEPPMFTADMTVPGARSMPVYAVCQPAASPYTRRTPWVGDATGAVCVAVPGPGPPVLPGIPGLPEPA